jgi:hypothetical protein
LGRFGGGLVLGQTTFRILTAFVESSDNGTIRRLQLEDFHVSGERVIEVDLCGKAARDHAGERTAAGFMALGRARSRDFRSACRPGRIDTSTRTPSAVATRTSVLNSTFSAVPTPVARTPSLPSGIDR